MSVNPPSDTIGNEAIRGAANAKAVISGSAYRVLFVLMQVGWTRGQEG